MKHCYKRLKASLYGSIRLIFIINHFKSRTLFNIIRLHHFISIAQQKCPKNVSQRAIIRYITYTMSVKINFPEHNKMLEIDTAKIQYALQIPTCCNWKFYQRHYSNKRLAHLLVLTKLKTFFFCLLFLFSICMLYRFNLCSASVANKRTHNAMMRQCAYWCMKSPCSENCIDRSATPFW